MSDVRRMGLCRRSILNPKWHRTWRGASRSLFNFGSLDKCLVYVSVLFPSLKKDILRLRTEGAEKHTSKSHMSPLEQCILCRVLPKMGIPDEQIGFIWGISNSAVSKIKRKWFRQWGYAGKLLTDLDLYEDYVNLERPDDYYVNQLDDIGSQCDGKDFLTESI